VAGGAGLGDDLVFVDLDEGFLAAGAEGHGRLRGTRFRPSMRGAVLHILSRLYVKVRSIRWTSKPEIAAFFHFATIT
jgi:hypothetical protein